MSGSKSLDKFMNDDSLLLNDYTFSKDENRNYYRNKYTKLGEKWIHNLLRNDRKRLDNVFNLWSRLYPGKETEKEIKHCLNLSKKKECTPILLLVFYIMMADINNRTAKERLIRIFKNFIYFRKVEDLYKDSGNLLDLYKDVLHKNKPSKKSCLI